MEFKRSSFCESNMCVEVAAASKLGGVQVRDSKNPDVVLTFTDEEWHVFVRGVKDGQFDL